jgi:hypothetical protein
MKTKKISISSGKSLIFALSALSSVMLGTGCPIAGGKVDVPIPVPAQEIKGNAVLGLFKLNNINLPLLPAGHARAPDLATTLVLTDLEIRTVVSGDTQDASTSELLKPTLMGHCRPGQPSLDFMDELTVTIRHVGEPDSAAKTLAHYKRTETSPCSIKLETMMSVELLDYVKDYQIDGIYSGKSNSENITVGGYSRIFTDAEFGGTTDSSTDTGAPGTGTPGTGGGVPTTPVGI